MLLLLAILIPFLFVPLLWIAGTKLGARVGWLAVCAPVASTALLVLTLLNAAPGERVVWEWDWIPSLGLNLVFLVDGLSLFFGLVVSGMGVLVVVYSAGYLDDHYAFHGRFYAYLALFMGAMLGTVFAGNLLLMFVFWELTGIASFLLIGFLHTDAESRSGARMALLVTGSTGLAMLAGIVILGLAAGTYDLKALLEQPLNAEGREKLNLAFVLMAVGAFGKSAQFPFHFWLPNAMRAPTPVSAYLHSATMVKLGVFLIARVFPVFSEAGLWSPLLIAVSFGTMLLGALLALLSHDLKAVLAYSTVSQLGFLIGFYGMSPSSGAQSDLLHIINHVFYKGCLFMVVGIIDHSAGTRDLRHLGGLGARLPMLAVITASAAAAMAGLPGTTGFISKEYMLKAKFDYWGDGDFAAWYPMVMVTLASVLKVAFSVRIVWGVFGGRARPEVLADLHRPGWNLLFAPALLAAACVVFGLFPGLLGQGLTHFWTPLLHAQVQPELYLWHGITREFLLSLAIVVAGTGLYAVLAGARMNALRIPRVLAFDRLFESGVEAFPLLAKRITAALRSDRPFDAPAIVLCTFLLVVGGFLASIGPASLLPTQVNWEEIDPLRAFCVGLIAIAVVLVVVLPRWTGQLIALSIVGFLVTFYYVLFRAPDLAMTQILVEAATLLLVLLLLARFPRAAEIGEANDTRVRSWRGALGILVAAGMGVVMTLVTVAALNPRSAALAGDYYLKSTVPLAHGTNAVNTILVDFRGFDTLLEVTVLLIATLGAVGLLMRYRRSASEYAAGPMGPAGSGIELEDPTESKPDEKGPNESR
jgi:NADH:ubiquinone oxidoreductase subunit 5 (subunit L)/multisubunit Na+/H+ antiporter MnhA subunit